MRTRNKRPARPACQWPGCTVKRANYSWQGRMFCSKHRAQAARGAKRHEMAKWLGANTDGHHIGALSLLEDAAKALGFVVTIDTRKGLATFTDPASGASASLGVFSREEFAEQIEARGKGGTLARGSWHGFAGLDLARCFARLAGVEYRGAFGRGSEFRNVLEALRAE